MARCLKQSFKRLKERNTSLPRNFSIANAKWNCRVVYTRIWKSECFQLVERKGLTVLEVQLTKNFIHALLVMVVLPGPKIIKLKTQIHNGSLEPLCFPTRLSPALLHQERISTRCIIVATCGNGSPQSGRLFNWECTMLSIAYSYDTLVRRFFITCLSNTYLLTIYLFHLKRDYFHFLMLYFPLIYYIMLG